MINNTDLRINNLVLYRGEVSVVKGVLSTSVDLLVEPCINFTKMALLPSLKPIPLTEEWLVKLGFEGFLGAYYHDSISVLFLKKPYVESDTYLVKTTSLDKITIVKFVHQCQNLIFTLTGQELTIKL